MVGTVTNKGLEMMAKLLVGVSTSPMKYIALGSGTTAEANDQTALVNEITTNGGARAEGTASYVADYQGKVTKTFTITGELIVNEVGLLDAAADGNMAYRAKLAAARNLINGDSLIINITHTMARP